MAESVRDFKLWLFGLVGSHGGAAGRFIPKTLYNLGNIFIYDELHHVSCIFCWKINFFADCLSKNCSGAILAYRLGARYCCLPGSQLEYSPAGYRDRKGQLAHHRFGDGPFQITLFLKGQHTHHWSGDELSPQLYSNQLYSNQLTCTST